MEGWVSLSTTTVSSLSRTVTWWISQLLAVQTVASHSRCPKVECPGVEPHPQYDLLSRAIYANPHHHWAAASVGRFELYVSTAIIYKKLSCRWQSARRLCTSMLCCQYLPSGELLRFIDQIVRLLPTPLLFDALNKGDSLELSGSYLVWENYTVPRNKVNSRQYWIEMPNLNSSWQNYVHWILSISLNEWHNVVRKHLLTVELLIFKYWRQNISAVVTLISAVTGPEVTFVDRATLRPIGRVKPCNC